MRCTSLLVVHISLPTAANVVVRVLRPSLVHCRLWDYVAIVCTPRLGRLDVWRLNIARTTALYAWHLVLRVPSERSHVERIENWLRKAYT